MSSGHSLEHLKRTQPSRVLVASIARPTVARFDVLALVAIVASMSGCQAIETIFKAGAWVGIIGVLLVLGLIAAAVGAFRR